MNIAFSHGPYVYREHTRPVFSAVRGEAMQRVMIQCIACRNVRLYEQINQLFENPKGRRHQYEQTNKREQSSALAKVTLRPEKDATSMSEVQINLIVEIVEA